MEPNFDSAHERLAALDALRGLAILAVVASHVGLVFGADLPAARALAVPALGVGVDLFFVISGLVVAENARRLQREAQGAFWRGALAFWGRRILRIGLPTWLVVLLIAASQAAGIPLGATEADLAAAAGFYANFHWAPCFESEAGCGALLASSHFWSLATEVQFYLAAPFLMAIRPKWTALVCIAVLAADPLRERPWGGFWWTFRLDGLAMGVLLSLGAARRWPLPRIGVGTASFWLVVASILARLLGVLASGLAILLVAMIFAMVVASTIRTEPRLHKFVLLQRLGELSFSIYLVHLPIMTGVHEIVGAPAPAILALLVAIAAILCSALLFELSITKPAQILGRRFSEWVCGHGAGDPRAPQHDEGARRLNLDLEASGALAPMKSA
jgi:peptidoglycan/LPS O-acetylase OafA/YrhL